MSVLLETSLGDIVIDLLWEKAPLASKNFIKLCQIKYYNGALFFDVQKSYLTRVMHEKKEPSSLNHILYGEQAKYFEDQVDPERKHDRFGTVSTSNVGPNMNDSNFFITLSENNIESLNGKHTIFGVIAEGKEVLQKVNEAYVDEQNRPYKNIRILHTLVLEDPFEDPPGLEIPENSPEINYDDTDRLDVNDKIDLIEGTGRTEEEIIEETKRHEAKSKAIVLEMLNDLPDADIKPPDNILFVCKLNPLTEEDDLETIFSQFGPIKSCEIIRDWKTGASLQYSFIEFETEAACEEAYFKMENALIDERRIHVDFSQSVSKYWYKYKSGNPIAFDKGKGDGHGPGKQKHRNQPRLELKGRHREDKGGYGIVIDEDEANTEARRHRNQKPDHHHHKDKGDRGDRGGRDNRDNRDNRGDRGDKGRGDKGERTDRGDRGDKDRGDRGKDVKERERERAREMDRIPAKARSRSRNRSGSRDRKHDKKHQDSSNKANRDKSRSRSRSPKRDKHRGKDSHRDEKRRDDDSHKKQSSRNREEEDRRHGKKVEDKKKRKVSSSRSSSSSSSSGSSRSSSRSSS